MNRRRHPAKKRPYKKRRRPFQQLEYVKKEGNAFKPIETEASPSLLQTPPLRKAKLSKKENLRLSSKSYTIPNDDIQNKDKCVDVSTEANTPLNEHKEAMSDSSTKETKFCITDDDDLESQEAHFLGQYGVKVLGEAVRYSFYQHFEDSSTVFNAPRMMNSPLSCRLENPRFC